MLPCQKDLFSLDASMHYINCAYMGPLLKSVEDAGIKGMQKKRNPFLVSPANFFDDAEEVRKLFGQLVNAEAGRIAVISSASYGMGIVTRNMKPAAGKKIITVHEEFPSDVYSLHRMCTEYNMELITVKPPETKEGRAKQWNEKLLEAITPDTALINISSVHWADGSIFNLEAIGNRAKEVGALFVVDGTQSVGAMPFDVKKYKVDALICAGYKWLLGPYTSGLAYFGEYFDDGIPIEESWLNRMGSENFRALVNYDETPAYKPLAGRYNMGEYSNFINLPMLKASLTQILKWTPQAIQEYCNILTQPLIESLIENGFGVEEENYRAKHLFGCRLPTGLTLEQVQQQLAHKKLVFSIRGNDFRLSPHLYNDEKDILQLQAALLS